MKKVLSTIMVLAFMLTCTQTFAWKLFGSEKYKLTSKDGCTVTTYKKTYFLGFVSSREPQDVQYICGPN
ncbi:hypothetical protein [Polaribacter sp.]|uniref:hypothetical protein n=1 Tax=Polaribacter sp. TaxID=1920175 RepID=UPI003F6BD8E9